MLKNSFIITMGYCKAGSVITPLAPTIIVLYMIFLACKINFFATSFRLVFCLHYFKDFHIYSFVQSGRLWLLLWPTQKIRCGTPWLLHSHTHTRTHIHMWWTIKVWASVLFVSFTNTMTICIKAKLISDSKSYYN